LNKEQISEFERLVKQNMKRAYFVALAFLGSHDSAVEVSQEAFIRAYRHFNKFDKSKNFFTWYYKILKNLGLNFIRDGKKKGRRFFLKSEQETCI
jgi:RNA polymerase sigma-70 factor, ECF subfamily